MKENGAAWRRNGCLVLNGRVNGPQLLKSVPAIVVREPENSIAAVAEARQKNVVCVATVVGNDLIQDQVEIPRVSSCPAPYIPALWADHQEASVQRGASIRVPCWRVVRGNTVWVFSGCRLSSAVEKA
jgi:hypothetical protein